MRKFIAFGPALVVLITALVTLVAAPAAVRLIGYASTDSQVQLARHELESDNILKQIDKAVRNIADAVEPSVVHIGVEESNGYGRFQAEGSGWVFDTQGHIVTNSHVVRGSQRTVVQFSDGRAMDAQVVGQDVSNDVAVLKVATTEGLFPVQRASGVALHQGDRVYAFGSPFGFKFSMTEGIVSGLGRSPDRITNNTEGYTNYIQTDAAVNPGNSGGPLVNTDGKLIGMNVAIATAATQRGDRSEGQNSGISFAIPLATIERTVDQLISGRAVTRGYLGIVRPTNDEFNRQELARLGFTGWGVAVSRVEPGGPADKAGIMVDDVIVKLNNEQVTKVNVLVSAIANDAPGDKVSVELWRAGKLMKVDVVLAELVSEVDKTQAKRVVDRFGLASISETSGQVIVARVRAPSLAYQAGMRPNQRIVDVDGVKIRTGEEFFTTLASKGLQQGRELKVLLESPDGQRVEVKLSGN